MPSTDVRWVDTDITWVDTDITWVDTSETSTPEEGTDSTLMLRVYEQ